MLKGFKHTEETKTKMRLARIGKPLPMEARRKISEIQKGRTHSEDRKDKIRQALVGRTSPMKGRKHSDETKAKMRLSRSGANSPLWQGGITPINNAIRGSTKYREWQNSVFQRDSYTCQSCGDTRRTLLVAHHIQNFSSHVQLRFSLSNGVTFCRPCHKIFHFAYGKKHNNLFQTIQFVSNLLTYVR